MIKLIGYIVLIAVFVLGFPSLKRWYDGQSSPKEAVSEIRENMSQAIAPTGLSDSNTNTTTKAESPTSTKKSNPNGAEDRGAQNSGDDLARQVLKDVAQ